MHPIISVQMESVRQDYATFFRLTQRPFSLTSDPKFYFRSRSHARVFDALSAAIARRESVMILLGDLGVGKTMLCRTMLDQQDRGSRTALVGNALVSPADLLRVLLQDLGAVSKEEASSGDFMSAPRARLLDLVDQFLGSLRATSSGAMLIIDEAHSLPPSTKEQVIEIATLASNHGRVLQLLLAGQPALGGAPMLPSLSDASEAIRARLLPLERDECDRYIAHRLAVAGGNAVTFSAQAVEAIYSLSGGVARLVNLLCERALQAAADAEASRVEPAMIQSAASALDLIRLRSRRFRWYGTTQATGS